MRFALRPLFTFLKNSYRALFHIWNKIKFSLRNMKKEQNV